MKTQIEARLNNNIARVRNLITLYGVLSGTGPGRRSANKADILRSAVVLLHATLEDFIRSVEYWKLPNASAAVLAKMALKGKREHDTKFSLGDLVDFRGITVDDLIKNSVNQHLDRSNYNNTTEIASSLTNIGIDVDSVNEKFPDIEALIKRRHQIVHRADTIDRRGRGHHGVGSIRVGTVNSWIDAVENFANAVLGLI